MTGRAADDTWTTPALAAAASRTSGELLALYRTLDAPAPGELDGEYGAALPIDRDADVRLFFAAQRRGHWVGKAYRPDPADPRRGEGHNRWSFSTGLRRSERFAWELGPSALDGRPALVMRYAAYRNVSGALQLVDEIRRLGDGVYVGLYRTAVAVPPFTRRQAGAWSAPEVFLLAGPVGPWVGPDDPHAETCGWRPSHRALHALLSRAAPRRAVGTILAALGRHAARPETREIGAVPPPLPVSDRATAAALAWLLVHLPASVKRAAARGPETRSRGDVLDDDTRLLVGIIAAQDALLRFLRVPSVPVWRRDLRRASRLVAGPELDVNVRRLAVAGADGPRPARLYRPGADSDGMLVWFHGGGWVQGDLDSHDAVCRQLALAAGVQVLAVDYRLAPEHRHPAATDDALAAFLDAVARADEFGIDPSRVAVGGDSAGGHLAAVTSQRSAAAGGPVPAAQLLVYPVTDLTGGQDARIRHAERLPLDGGRMTWFEQVYLPPGTDRTDPAVSPLFSTALEGQPPAVIVTAGFDVLCDEGRAYAARLQEAGVPVQVRHHPAMTHGFFNMLVLYRAAVEQAAVDLRGALETASSGCVAG